MLATSSLISFVAAMAARVVVGGAGVVVLVVVVVVVVVVLVLDGFRFFLTTIRLRSADSPLSAGLPVVLVLLVLLIVVVGLSVREGALVVVELLMRQETFSG